jgi:quercetin dioxygenase-like cupin family protein
MGEERRQGGEEERVDEDDGARDEKQPAHGRRVYGGPVWGTATEDLNATILEWEAGSGPQGEHVNAERDVVVVVVSGSLELVLDGKARTIGPGEVAVVEKGSRRRLTAGPQGVRYVTVHRKRPGLAISSNLSPSQ